MSISTLERCVGSAEEFLEKHWSKAPLLVDKGAGAFDDLASLDDLDSMVSSLGLPASRLRMVKSGRTLAPSEYTVPPGNRRGRPEDLASPAKVYECYATGATIVIESLHRYWRPLTGFCRGLEMALGHRAQVNAYITPPGAQGFDVHRDDHDVFVLQVSGSKHWIVSDRDDEDRVLIDQMIAEGAALYIPKEFPHAARTGEDASAHLTVGILTHDRMDVLREMLKLAAEEPMFAERLPVTASSDPAMLRSSIGSVIDDLRAWLDKLDPEALEALVARRIGSSGQPLLRGQLRQLAALADLDADCRVRLRRGASMLLLERGEVLKVVLADRELEMPAWVAPAVELIGDGDELRVSDLHGCLDPESAKVLVRRLVREGALEVVLDG